MPFLFAFVILLVALTISILYHSIWTKRIFWLSLGERLTGYRISGGVKLAHNPFGISRWALFGIIFITLIFIGNTWDRLSNGYIYSITEIIFRTLILTLVSHGLISMGAGKLGFVIYPIGFYCFLAIQILNVTTERIRQTTTDGFVFFLIGLAVLNGLVALAYQFLRNKSILESI